ncbi:MAG: hypothetical protein R3C18_20080 [Planctomycetaceae bacterium]
MPRAFNKSCLFVLTTSLLLGNLAFGQSVKIAAPEPVTVDGVMRVPAADGDDTDVTLEVVKSTGATKLKNVVVSPGIRIPNATFAVDLTSGDVTAADNPLPIPKGNYNTTINLTITATYQTGNSMFDTTTVEKLMVDSAPPEPSAGEPFIEVFPGGSGRVTIRFADNDLARTVTSSQIVVQQTSRIDGTVVTDFDPAVTIPQSADPVVGPQGNELTLEFRNLGPGEYTITYKGLKDLVGNSRTTDDDQTDGQFIVRAGRQRGKQVEFPRFLDPGNTSDEFDPGDLVDTRVVQLYYFRDARRVAELINRNVQSLNQVGYEQAQRFAQDARTKANTAVDERRYKETVAYEAAQKTREAQRQLQQAQQELAQAQQDQAQIAVEEAKVKYALDSFRADGSTGDDVTAQVSSTITELTEVNSQIASASSTDPDLPDLKNKKAALETRLRALRSLETRTALLSSEKTAIATRITSLQNQLNELPTQIQQYQQAEIDTRNTVVKAEATELRASQEQFRREVAASLTDPDTFVAGRISSIDPVTQVSISVVGTSRLQLRGPIKGINKIRRMIHQIDSPVGQVKIGIHTVQVNGEHGDRMDFVYEKVNKEIAHSRFLVNTSGRLLRRAVQEVANEVAMAVDQGGAIILDCPPADLISMCQDRNAGFATLDGAVMTNQTLRDWRYLYAFYGADFIDELRRMDSELLNTENKMLSLHSMDTISLAGALSVASLADHPVRQQILFRFQELIASELPEREREYVQALTQVGRQGNQLSFFPNRAAKVDERNAEAIYFNAQRTYHFPNTITFFNEAIPGQGTLNPVQYSTLKLAQALKAQLVAEMEYQNLVLERSLLEQKQGETEDVLRKRFEQLQNASETASIAEAHAARTAVTFVSTFLDDFVKKYRDAIQSSPPQQFPTETLTRINQSLSRISMSKDTRYAPDSLDQLMRNVDVILRGNGGADDIAEELLASTGIPANDVLIQSIFTALERHLQKAEVWKSLQTGVATWRAAKLQGTEAHVRAEDAKSALEEAQEQLFAKRLLEQFMDEQEEKSVALMEALREHSSNVDNYLKRVAIALEDDVQAQFYEPAFQRIRRVSRTWDVTLGQIETTTVLTNNRMLAKVDPAATFEFDLPHRDILLTEAMGGTKALVDEYGNLLKDPTFLAGTSAFAGMPPTGVVGDDSPITGIPGLDQNPKFGSELEKLIPDPAIYKFETGTGFEIRPIIQPDGHSIVYTFDYMYSTNVREPVRADEKHLGRIKRHFVHTDVQTSSYELREVSRYTVALKASRTDRGVPLFEDIPGLGVLFRPLPSQESSLQTNIILASSTIYPTVFDLMGLRWSPYVDDLGSTKLVDEKESQRSRREELRTQLFETVRDKVNSRIGIPKSRPAVRSMEVPGISIP